MSDELHVCGTTDIRIPECKSGTCDLGNKTITESGTYDAEDDGYDGYYKVIVDIPEPTPNLQAKTAMQNGLIVPDLGYDGLSYVNVSVPNTYTAGDEGKVVNGGALVSQTSRTVTANGNYDTTTNNSVTVNVQLESANGHSF